MGYGFAFRSESSYFAIEMQTKANVLPQEIQVAGLDMTMSNLGFCRFFLDLDTLDLRLDVAGLVSTEKGNRKLVRANSDDLRRSIEIRQGVDRVAGGCDFVFAEVPSGSQSSRAALSFGITIGILASLRVPLIQVMPSETKIHTVGRKTATKDEMIQWSYARYPQAPWQRYQRDVKNRAGILVHSAGDVHDDNEHMADAMAVVHAGLRTEEFQRWYALRGRGQISFDSRLASSLPLQPIVSERSGLAAGIVSQRTEL